MTKAWEERFEELVDSDLPWRKTTSHRYKNCPHEYAIKEQCKDPKVWSELAKYVRVYGEERKWRGHDYVFLTVGDLVYWVDYTALNRTLEVALDNGGWPSVKNQKLIQKKYGQAYDKKRK